MTASNPSRPRCSRTSSFSSSACRSASRSRTSGPLGPALHAAAAGGGSDRRGPSTPPKPANKATKTKPRRLYGGRPWRARARKSPAMHRAGARGARARSPRPPRSRARRDVRAAARARDALALLGRVPVPLAGAVEVLGVAVGALAVGAADRVRDPRPARRARVARGGGAGRDERRRGRHRGEQRPRSSPAFSGARARLRAAAALARLALPAGGGGGRRLLRRVARRRRRARRDRAAARRHRPGRRAPAAARRARRRRRRRRPSAAIVQSRARTTPYSTRLWAGWPRRPARRVVTGAVGGPRARGVVQRGSNHHGSARSTSFHETRGGGALVGSLVASSLVASSLVALARAARPGARARGLLPFDARARTAGPAARIRSVAGGRSCRVRRRPRPGGANLLTRGRRTRA